MDGLKAPPEHYVSLEQYAVMLRRRAGDIDALAAERDDLRIWPDLREHTASADRLDRIQNSKGIAGFLRRMWWKFFA